MVKSMCGIPVTRVMSTLIRRVEILRWNLSGGLSHVVRSGLTSLKFFRNPSGQVILLSSRISSARAVPKEPFARRSNNLESTF